MTNVDKKNTSEKMRSHISEKEAYIKESFKVIDDWLPTGYVALVQKKVNVAPGTIRNVRSARKGNLNVIRALLKVAKENKKFIEELKDSI